MVNLRLTQGPLPREQNEQILKEYNRLTGARIPIGEFEHWVQRGPAGPAWHALLETDDGLIVGHTSLIPLRTSYDPGLIPAKSEFSFVKEEFRSTKIRGHEKGRIKFLVLVDELFKHCLTLGWGPYFVSTREANQPLSRRVGCKTAEFPLWECILIRNPRRAARETPNVRLAQRAALFAAGAAQQIPWNLLRLRGSRNRAIHVLPVGAEPAEPITTRLSLFEDVESLRWRYFENQYVRFGLDSASGDYVIAKRGGVDRYTRVVQCRFSKTDVTGEVIAELVRQADRDGALGVRWAVYDNGDVSKELVSAMKKRGFLAARRVRILMLYGLHPELLDAANWNVNDSFVSFDP